MLSKLAADLGSVIHHLLRQPSVFPGFRAQFRPQEREPVEVARNINAAFLISLTGKRLSHPARGYLSSMSESVDWGSTAAFYLQALDRIEGELAGPGLEEAADNARDLVRYLETSPDMAAAQTLERFWNFFFPEGDGLMECREEAVRNLREKRTVSISKLSPNPIKTAHEQVLFSSNVLLTVPVEKNIESLHLAPDMKEALKAAVCENQAYWYDHPIPMGIETDKSEAVYGLRALDQALRFEIDRGNAPPDAKVSVLLSISTTHHGLQALAHEYMAGELEKAGGIDHLRIYAVAQKDVLELLDTTLLPAVEHFFPNRDPGLLTEMVGVDGEYGRHYSFLKAMAALWHVLLEKDVRATFKIDLDQVFPQEALVSETGKSAFEHLADPLWGAEGTDCEGRGVELGLLAGALVNEADITQGLFTSDIKWPKDKPLQDQWIFAGTWPQALSTEAEMMAQYGTEGLDGKTACLQRVHVTGGTTGILVEYLRRHRPFTPGWIGRAEDQAYLLSVLFPEDGPSLRYAHASGLIMRHDKEAFAAEAMEAARIGKLIGDYVRILTFTTYARALPWKTEDIKNSVDPFTGCFISKLPVTIACLRMALTAAGMFASGTDKDIRDGTELVRAGAERLGEAIDELCDTSVVRDRLQREREGWDLFYDTLDALEKALAEGDPLAESLRDMTQELVEGWKI